MTVQLQFCPLAQPLSAKILLDYYKDAGWKNFDLSRRTEPERPMARVQWVSVLCDGKQAGVARLEMAAPEFCFVSDLIISTKYRGQGMGRWLLSHIEQYCASFGIRRLFLVPMAGTRNFYTSQAFADDPLVPDMLRKDINPFQPKMFMPALS